MALTYISKQSAALPAATQSTQFNYSDPTSVGAAGGTFLVCDGEPWSLGEMVAFARQEMGRSPRLFSLPTHTLARIASLLGRRQQYEHVFGSLVVDDAAFRAATEFQPPETTEDGLRRMLRDLRLKRRGKRR